MFLGIPYRSFDLKVNVHAGKEPPKTIPVASSACTAASLLCTVASSALTAVAASAWYGELSLDSADLQLDVSRRSELSSGGVGRGSDDFALRLLTCK